MLSSALVLVLVILPLAGALLSWNVRETVSGSLDARLESLLNVVIADIEYPADGGDSLPRPQLGDVRFERPYSGWYWQMRVGDSEVITSRSLWDQRLPSVEVPGRHWRKVAGPGGQTLRMVQRRVQLASLSEPVLVSVAADLAEVEDEVARFQTLLAISLTTLGILLLVMIALQVRWGLAPLRRIERSLRQVESGQLRSLETDLPEELAGLARTINLVLERDRALIERGRETAGNLAHALKTPISVLFTLSESLPADRQPSFQKELHRLNSAIRHHLARASTAGPPAFGPGIDVGETLAPVLKGLSTLAERRGLAFEFRIRCPDPVRFEDQDLQEIAGNLLENAMHWAQHKVTLDAHQGPDELVLTIADDGPGMSDEECQQALQRGTRLDESRAGYGLGLAIVRDLVALYGGTLSLARSDHGGLKATARFTGWTAGRSAQGSSTLRGGQ